MTPYIALMAMGLLAVSPAVAQTTAPSSGLAPASPMAPSTAPSGTVGSTVNGAAPEKTGSTTAIGTTKPPGDAIGDRMGTRPDLEAKSRDLDQKINKGICVGCK